MAQRAASRRLLVRALVIRPEGHYTGCQHRSKIHRKSVVLTALVLTHLKFARGVCILAFFFFYHK